MCMHVESLKLKVGTKVTINLSHVIAYKYCGSLVVNICRLGIAHLVLKTCTIQVNAHWLKKHYFVHFWFPFREYFKIAICCALHKF